MNDYDKNGGEASSQDCIMIVVILVGVWYYCIYKQQNKESFGSVYDDVYLATYPKSETTPYSGTYGNGQSFINGPPNVG
jgi:hypothetical protein